MDLPIPGIYFVWQQQRAIARTLRLVEPITLGRAMFGDPKISTAHLRIEVRDGRFFLEDLGSRNGSHFNGQRVVQESGGWSHGRYHADFLGGVEGGWLRIGDTAGLLCQDVRPFEGEGDELPLRYGCFVSRTMAHVQAALDAAAAASAHLYLIGDPGCGRTQLGNSYAARLAPLRVIVEEEPIGDRERERELCDAVASAFDVRLVITKNHIAHADAPILGELLRHQAHRIEVPPIQERPDEVAAIIGRALTGLLPVPSPARLFLKCLAMLPGVSLQTLLERLPQLAHPH